MELTEALKAAKMVVKIIGYAKRGMVSWDEAESQITKLFVELAQGKVG